jgi:valyl-tRNA synthetase
MHSIELAKAYDPKTFEDRIYKEWKESGAFKPVSREDSAGHSPYVIVIPPPNVTGVLHLGHGLNLNLQDIVIRYHRMAGDPTLWVPGCDHAGIATQNVVDKKLRAKGIDRRELGREKFIEETWKVANEHHDIITRQIERMGLSVDWSRERFTLDEGLSRAVRDVFVTLYERDLLYKGNYLVNWCPSCGTALADDEVDHEETPGAMYHVRYPIVGMKDAFIELATTRPETMLGDTAVAVHPEDPRYEGLIGKSVILPLANREIPVVADAYVDREFGTGVVKITPAHDPNDWEVAKRHDLPVINILTPDGKLNDSVPEKYRGLPVMEARKIVLEDLKEGGFFIKEEKIKHSVGHCYRCHTVIEPFLSEQWFVRMKPLAEKALSSWRKGELIFFPKKWENTYEHWLENIRDWCVSRQLWWGHRIPAWTCDVCESREQGKLIVSREDPEKCPHCGADKTHLRQDEDVLDTWFSSWLWPFSTLGWEGAHCATADFKAFYPTTALITAYDIIFFWVSRMIMAGLEFTGKVPFRDIYIHGLIRDKQGRKMSKSLGNGLDPLELVDEFGADAVKFTLAFMCAQGQDLLVDRESFKMGSRFANKVWNASRYILMNLEGRSLVENPELKAHDRWILSRLNNAAKACGDAFVSYRYNDASQTAYEYFWNDFCDWYVEATKLSMREGDEKERDRATTVLLSVLAESLRLLHPLLPFVTEEIWSKLPEEILTRRHYFSERRRGTEEGKGKRLLISAAYPEFDASRNDAEAEASFGFLQELVRSIRTVRSECTIAPEKKLHVSIRVESESRLNFLEQNNELVKILANVGELQIELHSEHSNLQTPKGAIAVTGSGFDVSVFIGEAVDVKALIVKFTKDLEKDKKYIAGLKARLGNEAFVKNAPPELVEAEKGKLNEAEERTARMESRLRDISR